MVIALSFTCSAKKRFHFFHPRLVRVTGLEPARPFRTRSSQPLKTTNSITPASCLSALYTLSVGTYDDRLIQQVSPTVAREYVALYSLASLLLGTHPSAEIAAFCPARTDLMFHPGTIGWESSNTAYPQAAVTDHWCGWWESNPQAFRHSLLRTTCIPVPPHPHNLCALISSEHDFQAFTLTASLVPIR